MPARLPRGPFVESRGPAVGILSGCPTPASPRRTRRTTSCAHGAGGCSRACRRSCVSSPATSTSCCPSTRSSTRSGASASATPASARSRSSGSSAPSTAARSSTASSARRRHARARASSGSPRPSAAASRCRRSTSTRVGELHFVRDGHHRVAVARAQGRDTIDAHVVEVVTRVPADGSMSLDDLPLKSHERLFRERVPLPAPAQRADRAHRSRRVRDARRGRRGLGPAAHPARAALPRPRGGRPALVRGGVRAGRRDAARGRALRPPRDARPTPTCACRPTRYRIMRTQEWSDEAIERVRRGR